MPVWKYNENVIYKIMLKSTEYAVGLSKTEGSIEVKRCALHVRPNIL